MTTVLWLRLKKEVISMEIVRFEKYFKYKSQKMEVMHRSPYRHFCMANDNSRKFRQYQLIFSIQPSIVEFSIPILLGVDRLRFCENVLYSV